MFIAVSYQRVFLNASAVVFFPIPNGKKGIRFYNDPPFYTYPIDFISFLSINALDKICNLDKICENPQ